MERQGRFVYRDEVNVALLEVAREAERNLKSWMRDLEVLFQAHPEKRKPYEERLARIQAAIAGAEAALAKR